MLPGGIEIRTIPRARPVISSRVGENRAFRREIGPRTSGDPTRSWPVLRNRGLTRLGSTYGAVDRSTPGTVPTRTRSVASRTTRPALPDRSPRPRLVRNRLVGLEPMVGRPSTGLTVEFLHRRHRRTPAISRTPAGRFGRRHRRNQPYHVVGVVEDRFEVRLVADVIPSLVVEPRQEQLLTLRRFLPVPPGPVTGGSEKPLSLL